MMGDGRAPGAGKGHSLSALEKNTDRHPEGGRDNGAMKATYHIVRRRRRRRLARRPTSPAVWMARGVAVLLVLVLLSVTTVVAMAAGATVGVYMYFARQLPDPSVIEAAQEEFQTVKIYDRTGRYLLYEAIDPRPFRGDRTYVPLSEISPWVIKATIALEDRSFYDNPGVNVRGIIRAFFANLRGGPIQGGSSITQQLIKNVVFDYEERIQRSYTRKIKEVILALEITRRYPKDKILEWYLNYNFYGNNAYGIEAAAQVYFNKSAKDLNLAEAAMLAHLPQFPALNPFQNPEIAKRRQWRVLQAMVAAGYITPEEAEAAYAQELDLRDSVAERYNISAAPHFALYVLEQLEKKFNTPEDPFFIWRKGLVVYTTLDYELQKEAERIVREQVQRLQEEGREARNAAAVVLRANTGEILAMVGSVDFYNEEIDGEVNMAISPRQPGSSFKPFTYAYAFSTKEFYPAKMVLDVRQVFPDPETGIYVPENFDRRYHGPETMREALQRSHNIPAVWTLAQVGVKNVVDFAHRMGITTLNKDYYGLSLTLGGGEVTLLDMTYAFSVFANNGVMVGEPVPPAEQRPGYRTLNPVAILQVRDSVGNILYQYDEPQSERIISPQLAYMMNHVLSDPTPRPPEFGRYAQYLVLEDRPVAAKTGTSNDFRDAWTIGYTPQVVVGVWVGNADNTPMKRVSGAVGAAPIFHRIMQAATRDLPPTPFYRPPGIVEVDVCWPSGLLPTPECREAGQVRTDIFFEDAVPTEYDNVWRAFEINRNNGKLATPYTPPELRERRVYMILPPEAADWLREQNVPQPPRVYDDEYGPTVFNEEVAIITPRPFSYVRDIVEIQGNARGPNFSRYRVEFGAGLSPTRWTPIGPEHYNQVERNILEFWDTRGLPEGLYTLRLSVFGNDGSVRTAETQVTVDNTPPRVRLSKPMEGDVYVMEDDEWVTVQPEIEEEWAVDRVEFFLDGVKFAESTVPPFNQKWTITMSDTIPLADMAPITATRPLTLPDGTVVEEVYTVTQVITETLPDGSLRLIQMWDNGMMVISDTQGYTESHVITVKVFDKAGNEAESPPVRIYVVHKEEETASNNGHERWVRREVPLVGVVSSRVRSYRPVLPVPRVRLPIAFPRGHPS